MDHPPPPDLPDAAKTKWTELVADIEGDTLSPMMRDTIASYARAYAEEQDALRLIAECPNQFLVADDGKVSVNPLRKIVDTARAQMQRLRRELAKKLPSTTTTRGDCKRRLLLEIQRRHLEIADETPTHFDRAAWEDEIEHGPLFSPGIWFDCQGDDAARMRWTRVLRELVADGLVIESKEEGRKHANVRLSDTGEQQAAA